MSTLLDSAVAACPTFPYMFTNGTTADANQINSDFNNVVTCFAPLYNPVFTGAVGIGTTTPGALLDIYSSSGNSTAFNLTNVATNGHVWSIYSSGGGPAAAGSFGIYDSTSGGNRLVITAGGNVGIGTAAPTYTLQVNGTAGGTSGWTTISDARLKKNVRDLNGALALIARLRPVRYDWRPVGEREVGKTLNLPVNKAQIGFIAQEVASVVPEAAVLPRDSAPVDVKISNADGSTTSIRETSSLYGMTESRLIPLLVAAIKEQQVEIKELQSALESLKASK